MEETSSNSNGQGITEAKQCLDPEDLTLGKLAVKFNLLTREQLQEAIVVQRQKVQEGEKRSLREVIIDLKLISADRLNHLLAVKEMRETRALDRQFGEAAMKKAWTVREDIEAALEKQTKLFTTSRTIVRVGDILVKGCTEGCLTLSRIKEALVGRGINHGLKDDDILNHFIETHPKDKPFLVAEGTSPLPPQDPEIKYYFDTDPNKIGTVKEGGVIDFRDHGAIPQIKKDDLLAELIPGTEGSPGLDVFGQVIPPAKLATACIRTGSGAKLEEGGRIAVAQSDGRPEISTDGRIFVFPEFHIDGDVDFSVGHVDFDGYVVVRGAVRDGFKVKSGSLLAEEIHAADIEVVGDIVVLGGVIGAELKAGGNIRAKYISKSNVESRGDIVVENEVRHAYLAANGACIVNSGNICASRVYAYKWIEARQVGSEAAQPNILNIGVDVGTERELDRIKTQIAEQECRQKQLQVKVDELYLVPDRFFRKISQLCEVWEQSAERKRILCLDMPDGREAGQASQDDKFDKALRYFDSAMNQAAESLESIADQHEETVDQIVAVREEILASEKEVVDLHYEIEWLAEGVVSGEDKPYVKITGMVGPETTVKGPHAKLIFKRSVSSVMVEETKETTEHSTVRWKMKVTGLE